MKMTNFSSLSHRKAVNAPQRAGFTVIHQKELMILLDKGLLLKELKIG